MAATTITRASLTDGVSVWNAGEPIPPEARERVCAAVQSGEYGDRELTIRINGIGTQWHDADLRAAVAAGPNAVVVPTFKIPALAVRVPE